MQRDPFGLEITWNLTLSPIQSLQDKMMSESENVQLHVFVKGMVQGVGFRAFVLEQALSLGLSGWVRNRWNGSVEVLAEGDRPRLEALLAALRKGPPHAQVSETAPTWQAAQGIFESFTVRYSE